MISQIKPPVTSVRQLNNSVPVYVERKHRNAQDK